MSRHDEGAVSEADQTDGFVHGGMGRRAGARWEGRAVAPSRRPAGLRRLDVLRHIDQHRPGPTLDGNGESLAHRVGQLGHVFHQHAVLGDRLGDADDVGLLKGVPPDHRARDLAGDRHDGCVVHVRGGEPGDEVGGARARGRHAHARPSARARVAIRRVRGGLFVTHEDVPETGVFRQRVIERHDRATGVAEHQVHTLLDEGAAEDLGAGQLLGHAHRLSPGTA